MGSTQKQAGPNTLPPISFSPSLQQTHAVGKSVWRQVTNERLAQGHAGQVIPPLKIMKQAQPAVSMAPAMTTQPYIQERDMFGTKARSVV